MPSKAFAIDTILVRSEDLATATQRNGGRAALVGTLAEVRKGLFNWDAVEAPLTATSPNGITPIDSHKAIVRSDNGGVVGIVGAGYQVHSYQEWLTDNLANIVDDKDVIVQSAGLLNSGSRAWVQIAPNSEPKDMGGGFKVSPFILAGTSLDGSTATIYKRNAIAIVCQNTYAASMSGKPDVRIKHTRNSAFKIQSAREALDVMLGIQDEFESEVQAMLATEITDKRFEEIVTEFLGGKPEVKEGESTRGATIFDRKFEDITSLWRNDIRVAQWRGTGLGAMQAFSTYQQHVADVRGATRAERNADRLLSGAADRFDATVRDLITA